MLRTVFLGTPEFAIPSLRALLSDPKIEVVGVITQPDRPSGRGNTITAPPVKVFAQQAGIEVHQPLNLRKDPETIGWLEAIRPNFLVTAAFGQILSQRILDIPRCGTVNVHASLLPCYRGPNPVQWAIINGDKKTGVTTMLVVLGVDEGPMLLRAETDIDPEEDAVSLSHRLAEVGAEILIPSMHMLLAQSITPIPQDVFRASYAPKLQKEDAVIDWAQPAERIHDKVRGQQPWPGALSRIGGETLKILKTRSPLLWAESEDFINNGKPGEILAIIKSGLVVQTGTIPLLVELIQPPGKSKMPAWDWANGVRQRGIDITEFEAPEIPER